MMNGSGIRSAAAPDALEAAPSAGAASGDDEAAPAGIKQRRSQLSRSVSSEGRGSTTKGSSYQELVASVVAPSAGATSEDEAPRQERYSESVPQGIKCLRFTSV